MKLRALLFTSLLAVAGTAFAANPPPPASTGFAPMGHREGPCKQDPAQCKEAAAKFWDQNIGPSSIQIEPHESFTCASEAAHVLTLTTKLPTGLTFRVHGIFTYRVDDAGRIVSLRGFWDMTDLRQLA